MGDTRPPFLCRDGNRDGDGDGDGLPSPDQARPGKPTSQAKPQSHVNVNENCNCRAAGSELNWAGLVAQCDNEICSRQRNGFLTLTGHWPLATGHWPSWAGRGAVCPCELLLLMAFAVNVSQPEAMSLGEA